MQAPMPFYLREGYIHAHIYASLGLCMSVYYIYYNYSYFYCLF